MPATEAGHHANRAYTDQDGNLHLNGATLYADESGTAISGTDLAAIDGVIATPAEINRVADQDNRVVAAGAGTLALTVALHEGKTVICDQAAGCAFTLPSAAAAVVGA